MSQLAASFDAFPQVSSAGFSSVNLPRLMRILQLHLLPDRACLVDLPRVLGGPSRVAPLLGGPSRVAPSSGSLPLIDESQRSLTVMLAKNVHAPHRWLRARVTRKGSHVSRSCPPGKAPPTPVLRKGSQDGWRCPSRKKITQNLKVNCQQTIAPAADSSTRPSAHARCAFSCVLPRISRRSTR